MQWIQLSMTVPRVAMETVATLFDDYAVHGIIEEDIPDNDEELRVILYGDSQLDVATWMQEIKDILGEASIPVRDVVTETITDQDWSQSWKQWIDPVELIPGIVACPAWKTYDKKPGEQVIIIDSELSFGTGSHDTTKGCAQLFHTYGAQSQSCLDVGTGTGILLLIAHALGVPDLVGIDIDADAAKQASINCEMNGAKAQIICGDLVKDFHGTVDCIFANLTVDPLLSLLPVIATHLTPNGLLIISGIHDARLDEILPLIEKDWIVQEERVDNEWHTFALKGRCV